MSRMPPEIESVIESVDDRAFRHLVAAITDYGIYMLDRDGRIRTWNSGAERLTHYAAEEVLGRPFALFFTEDDHAAGGRRPCSRWPRGTGDASPRAGACARTGSLFWALAVLDAIRDDRGELQGFAKIIRDITERRAAEEALRRKRASASACSCRA